MSELTINTAQNVTINFTAASIGERISASLLYLLIKVAYCTIIGLILLCWLGHNEKLNSMDSYSSMATGILFLFPILVYLLKLESVFEGQTIGKKLMRVKVGKIEGY